jgi:hypothetical protein
MPLIWRFRLASPDKTPQLTFDLSKYADHVAVPREVWDELQKEEGTHALTELVALRVRVEELKEAIRAILGAPVYEEPGTPCKGVSLVFTDAVLRAGAVLNSEELAGASPDKTPLEKDLHIARTETAKADAGKGAEMPLARSLIELEAVVVRLQQELKTANFFRDKLAERLELVVTAETELEGALACDYDTDPEHWREHVTQAMESALALCKRAAKRRGASVG